MLRGRDHVGVLFVMDGDGANIRQIGFEQDQDYCPTDTQRRACSIHALGIHGHPSFLQPAAVQHESRWHGSEIVLRQQLLLAQ